MARQTEATATCRERRVQYGDCSETDVFECEGVQLRLQKWVSVLLFDLGVSKKRSRVESAWSFFWACLQGFLHLERSENRSMKNNPWSRGHMSEWHLVSKRVGYWAPRLPPISAQLHVTPGPWLRGLPKMSSFRSEDPSDLPTQPVRHTPQRPR